MVMSDSVSISIPAEQQEEWRDSPGHPGYQVSTLGRVRSAWRRRGKNLRSYISDRWRILRPQPSGRGYLVVQIRESDRCRKNYIHRLVLEAFVGPCPEGMEGRHIETNDVTDNRLCNLAWGTKVENSQDRRRHGTDQDGANNHMARLTLEQVREAKELRAAGVMVKDLAVRFGLNRSNMSRVLNSRRYI
jgi:hypothetical protein